MAKLYYFQMETASAVLILANRSVDNQDYEDTANIMRATAVKNFRADVRIVIQLLQHRNKVSRTLVNSSGLQLLNCAMILTEIATIILTQWNRYIVLISRNVFDTVAQGVHKRIHDVIGQSQI
jgi:hypothetical protein